jgi:hypothetical protein
VSVFDSSNMSPVTTAAAVFLIQLLLLDPTKGAKILVVPTAVNSHVLYFGRLADELARLGHDVHMLIPSSVKIPEGFAGNGPNTTGNGTRGNYEITVYPVDDAEPYVSSPNASENLVKTAMSRSAIEHFRLSMEFGLQLYTHMERDCVRLLENRPVMDAVRTAGYQFAIMDLLAFHCYFSLPYGADIPFGSLSLAWTTLMYRVPRLPSFHSFFQTSIIVLSPDDFSVSARISPDS